MKLNRIISALGLVLIVFSMSACIGQKSNANSQTEKIMIEGSTSMQKIMQELADTYQDRNPKVNIEIIADGSSAGIKAANEGKVSIGMASREIKDEEKRTEITINQLAWDAIAVIVNIENAVTNLTNSQIAQIYTKEITNWKDLGGKNAPVVVIARDASSGTREAFDTIFNVKDKIYADQEAAKTGEVKTLVAQNPNAIGYISLTFTDKNVKPLDIDGIKATEANIENGSYTVKRPFNILTKKSPDAATKAFIEFIYSEEGKAIIGKEAFPVSK